MKRITLRTFGLYKAPRLEFRRILTLLYERAAAPDPTYEDYMGLDRRNYFAARLCDQRFAVRHPEKPDYYRLTELGKGLVEYMKARAS